MCFFDSTEQWLSVEYFAVKNTKHFICGFYVDAQIKEFKQHVLQQCFPNVMFTQITLWSC